MWADQKIDSLDCFKDPMRLLGILEIAAFETRGTVLIKIEQTVELAKVSKILLILGTFENAVAQLGLEELEGYVSNVILADIYDLEGK